MRREIVYPSLVAPRYPYSLSDIAEKLEDLASNNEWSTYEDLVRQCSFDAPDDFWYETFAGPARRKEIEIWLSSDRFEPTLGLLCMMPANCFDLFCNSLKKYGYSAGEIQDEIELMAELIDEQGLDEYGPWLEKLREILSNAE